MATTLLSFPAASFIPDDDAQLVAGDVAAQFTVHVGRLVLAFDDTEEEAATTPETPMPQAFAGGTLTAILHFYMASDVTNDISLDVFVEAKTPNVDALDMESATGWDAVNSGTVSLSGTTTGDPLTVSVTLTNKDSVAAGDLVRFGVRRDTDSVDDDAVGDLFLAAIEIQE